LGGTDRDDFSIDSSGNLTFRSSPDFENPTDSGQNNKYHVTVKASRAGYRSGSLGVTVNVTEFTDPDDRTASHLKARSSLRQARHRLAGGVGECVPLFSL